MLLVINNTIQYRDGVDKVRYTRLIESPGRYFFTRNQQIWGDISNSIINLQVKIMLHHSQGNNIFGAVFETVKQSGTNPVTRDVLRDHHPLVSFW